MHIDKYTLQWNSPLWFFDDHDARVRFQEHPHFDEVFPCVYHWHVWLFATGDVEHDDPHSPTDPPSNSTDTPTELPPNHPECVPTPSHVDGELCTQDADASAPYSTLDCSSSTHGRRICRLIEDVYRHPLHNLRIEHGGSVYLYHCICIHATAHP